MFVEHEEEEEAEEYDQTITTFSPEGRLLQVEYAFETVNRGATIIGITCSEGVVLGAEEPEEKLADMNMSRKIFEIDEHIGAAVVGLASDANVLIEQARISAQNNRLLYDEPIDVEIISKRIGDLKQMYTQYAGVRPFGVSVIFVGIDKAGKKNFVTDPSGSYRAFKAVAIGIGREIIEEILKKEYKETFKLKKATSLAVKCLSTSLRSRDEPTTIRIAVIPSKTRRFRFLSTEEISALKPKNSN